MASRTIGACVCGSWQCLRISGTKTSRILSSARTKPAGLAAAASIWSRINAIQVSATGASQISRAVASRTGHSAFSFLAVPSATLLSLVGTRHTSCERPDASAPLTLIENCQSSLGSAIPQVPPTHSLVAYHCSTQLAIRHPQLLLPRTRQTHTKRVRVRRQSPRRNNSRNKQTFTTYFTFAIHAHHSLTRTTTPTLTMTRRRPHL